MQCFKGYLKFRCGLRRILGNGKLKAIVSTVLDPLEIRIGINANEISPWKEIILKNMGKGGGIMGTNTYFGKLRAKSLYC